MKSEDARTRLAQHRRYWTTMKRMYPMVHAHVIETIAHEVTLGKLAKTNAEKAMLKMRLDTLAEERGNADKKN